MNVSSNCKKMMAFIMAVALVLSVLFIPSPQKAKAATDDRVPEVSFLGATIRILDADIQRKTQAMRIGIRIDNADKAADCAIKLTVSGNSYVVSTKAIGESIGEGDGVVNAQQLKMNFVDSNEHYVEYAIALYNIPRQNFYTPISVTGYAWGTDKSNTRYVLSYAWNSSGVRENSSPTVQRNIMGIVNALKTKYPLYNIAINSEGLLTKTVSETTDNLTVPDFDDYENNVGSAPTTAAPANILPVLPSAPDPEVEIKKSNDSEGITGSAGYNEFTSFDSEGNFVIDDNTTNNNDLSAVYIPLPSNVLASEKVVVQIYGYAGDDCPGFRAYIGTGDSGGIYGDVPSASVNDIPDDFAEEFEFIANKECSSLAIKGFYTEGKRKIQDLTIKSIGIYYPDRGENVPVLIPPANIKLKNTKKNNIEGVTVSDGKVYVNDARTDATTEFYIPLRSNLNADENVTVVFEGWIGKNNFEGNKKGFRAWVGNNGSTRSKISNTENTFIHISENKVGYFRETVNFTANSDNGNECESITIKGGGTNMADNSITDLEFDSVKVYYTDRGAVVPSAGPLPAPRPYSIDLFNSDGSINSDCVHNNNKTLLLSEYGRLVIEKKTGGEFGFALPAAQKDDGYDTVTIRFEDGSMSGTGSVPHYGVTEVGWIQGEAGEDNVNIRSGINFIGDSQVVINGDAGQNLSTIRFFDWGGTTVGSAKIESVIFSCSGEGSAFPAINPASPTPVPTAIPSADVYAVKKPTGSITIDGNANETVWNSAHTYPFKYYSGSVDNGMDATMKVLWDEENLYGVVEVVDPDISTGDGHTDWQTDGIDIFFDEDNTKESTENLSSNNDAFRYMYSNFDNGDNTPLNNKYYNNDATGSYATARYGSAPWGDSRIKHKITGTGYVVEFVIPFYRLSTANRVVGFDVAINDCHSNGDSNWRDNEVWFSGRSKNGTTKSNMWNHSNLISNLKLVNSESDIPADTVTNTALSSGNLVRNGNFEKGKIGWLPNYGSNNNVLENAVVDGSDCLLVTNRENASSGIKKTIKGSFKPGDRLNYQFKIKRTHENTNSQGFILSFNEYGNKYGSTPSSNSDNDTKAFCYHDHWTTVSGSYIVNSITDSIEVEIMEEALSYTGLTASDYNFYIDDVEIVNANNGSIPVPSTSFADEYNDTNTRDAATSAIAVKVTTPINPDGVVDSVWDGIPYQKFNSYPSGGKHTGDALAKIAWDSDYLYALVRVYDLDFDSTHPDHSYERDGGEIFLDEDACHNETSAQSYEGNDDAFKYQLTGFDKYGLIPCRTSVDTAESKCGHFDSGTSHGNSLYSGILWGTTFINDGYIMEYRIPWQNKNHAFGNLIYFELDAFDCSGGARNNEMFFITDGNELYQHAERFGRLILAETDGSTPEPTAVPTETPSPIPARLFATVQSEDASNIYTYNDAVFTKVNSEIDIDDGRIDYHWGALPWYKFRYCTNHTSNSTEPGDTAMAKLAWDANYLYALVQVKDSVMGVGGDGDWLHYGGELFLEESNNKTQYGGNNNNTYSDNPYAFQYRFTGFATSGKTTDEIKGDTGSSTAISQYSSTTQTEYQIINNGSAKDGYIMFYKVPWRLKNKQAGNTISFDLDVFINNGSDRTHEIFFKTTGGLYHHPELFADFRLADENGIVPSN